MENLVVVAGTVYPEPSPPGKIAMEYVKMLKKNYKVSVIYIQSGLKSIKDLEVDNVLYYSISNLRLIIETFCEKKLNRSKNTVFRVFYKTIFISMKLIARLQAIFLFPNNLKWHYKKSYKMLQKLNKQNKIDYIFSICNPFSAHLACRDFKRAHKDVHWVTFTVDPFSVSEKMNKIGYILKRKKVLKEEKIIYNEADYNLVSEEVLLSKTFRHDVNAKIFSIPYLINKPGELYDNIFDNKQINLVYAGSFYKDIRNPEYLFKVFKNLNLENIVLHLFLPKSNGYSVDKHIREFEGKIFLHQPVPTNKINEVLCSADFLIIVGNSIKEFKASKTFEYIATGKPIISFYRNNNIDTDLENYPLSLQINEENNSLEKNTQLIHSFICKNNNIKVSWEKIENLYNKHMPQSIYQQLMQAFKRM